jgi:predicted DsbA family dithiol-disulfide isomerase
MVRLRVYSDFVCPFSYLAGTVLTRLEAEDGITIEHMPFELFPAPLPPLDPRDPAWLESWDSTIRPLAGELGVAMVLPPVRPRTRKAHEAAAFAAERGRLAAMRSAIFHAHFVEGRDIGRIDVLVAIGESIGLDRTELKVTLDVDRYTDEVARAEAAAIERGITGVPTFVADGDERVGLHSHEALRDWLRGADRES